MTIVPVPLVWLLASGGVIALGAVVGRGARPLARIRGRAVVALGVFGLVLAASWLLQAWLPGLLGLPVVLGPDVAATAALLVVAAPVGRVRTQARVRTASLRRRTVPASLRAADLALPLTTGAALVLVLLATGATAAADESGRSRVLALRNGAVGSAAGPFPGWYYAAPLLVATVLLVAAAWLAMRRVTLLPAVSPDDPTDARWRRAVQRVLAATATAALLLDGAGIGWSVGSSLRSTIEVLPTGPAHAALAVIAVAATAAAPLLLVAAAGVLLTALRRAVGLGRRLEAVPA